MCLYLLHFTGFMFVLPLVLSNICSFQRYFLQFNINNVPEVNNNEFGQRLNRCSRTSCELKCFIAGQELRNAVIIHTLCINTLGQFSSDC